MTFEFVSNNYIDIGINYTGIIINTICACVHVYVENNFACIV